MQELQSKELEMNRRAVELEQAQWNDIQRAITHDHTYASSLICSEEVLVSFEKPSSAKVVMHKEQDEAPLQELIVLSDEREDEIKELGEEPLGQSEDAGIPVEVGKTILFMKWKLYTICLL